MISIYFVLNVLYLSIMVYTENIICFIIKSCHYVHCFHQFLTSNKALRDVKMVNRKLDNS